MGKQIALRLPFPPSANHYLAMRIFKRNDGKMIPMHYRTAKAKAFYDEVRHTVAEQSAGYAIEGRIALSIELTPPNKRVFDISNAVKCIEDALEESGVFLNDSQVDELHVKRLPPDGFKVGAADIVIQPIGNGHA